MGRDMVDKVWVKKTVVLAFWPIELREVDKSFRKEDDDKQNVMWVKSEWRWLGGSMDNLWV